MLRTLTGDNNETKSTTLSRRHAMPTCAKTFEKKVSSVFCLRSLVTARCLMVFSVSGRGSGTIIPMLRKNVLNLPSTCSRSWPFSSVSTCVNQTQVGKTCCNMRCYRGYKRRGQRFQVPMTTSTRRRKADHDVESETHYSPSVQQSQMRTRGMCTLWRCRSTPSLPGITFRVTCSA